MTRPLKIASRRSKMALVQTNLIIQKLKEIEPGLQCEIVEIVADGDYEKFKGAIKDLGGKGAFIKSLEVAILKGDADMAMHSMKDVPTDEDLPKGLKIAAVLKRSDIRDAAVCRQGEEFVALKEGAKVGTSSVRRASQLKAHFPHLEIVPLRGNADTRIQKVDDEEVDAAILARCGLQRIDAAHRISEVFEPDIMCPSAAQGIVGVECRTDDKELLALLAKMNHTDTFTCLMAEREMLKMLGGNCHTPVGGFCEITANRNLRLIAMVATPDGKTVLRGRAKMPFDQPLELGRAVAKQLLDQGAADIINKCSEAA